MKLSRLVFASLASVVAAGVLAQVFRGGFGGDPYAPEFETSLTARGVPRHSIDTPTWTNAPGFEADTFTFARVRYTRRSDVWWGGGYWWSDSPDSDLNLSWRLHQVTAINVNPDGRYVNLTDKELFDYPWIYMVEPGRLRLEDDEIAPLRKYLLNGGFLMADDFWGANQWGNFEREIKRVLPEREFVELPIDHPIFHCVYDLRGPVNKLQTMNRRASARAKQTGVTWETHEGVECKDMHVMAMMDDKKHIVVLATNNCDNGDGWEREGEDDFFFHEFSEKRAYPLAINIIFYAMTH